MTENTTATASGAADLPEALRLADNLQANRCHQAAAELRRLHKENERLHALAASAPVAPTQPDLRSDREESLTARIAELEAQLRPYLEAEAVAFARAQRSDRAESIANALFPRYDSVYARRHPEEKPPQWHEKSWWWNGVSIDWDESCIDPGCRTYLKLSSYVGGGETDEATVQFPMQWLDADSLIDLIPAFITEKLKEREARKAAEEAAQAQHEIEKAKATLRRLTGGGV